MKAKSDFKKEEDVNVLISKVDEVVGSQLENLLGGASRRTQLHVYVIAGLETPTIKQLWKKQNEIILNKKGMLFI